MVFKKAEANNYIIIYINNYKGDIPKYIAVNLKYFIKEFSNNLIVWIVFIYIPTYNILSEIISNRFYTK